MVQSFGQTHFGNKLYTYQVPKNVAIQVGSIVKIPFGKKVVLGVVQKLSHSKPKNLNKILNITDSIAGIILPKYYIELADWINQYYVSSPKNTWSMMLPSGLQAKSRINFSMSASKPIQPLNKLTKDQQPALKKINANKITLLHGITGSGKTEIYLHLIHREITNNKSVIILVPEIMLTTQIEQRLLMHFENVTILHSSLTTAKRKLLWLKAYSDSKNGKPVIILGTRSALFTPLCNLGLIVIDEEHEPSYKQESTPKYETQIVAAKIANIANAKLVLGSATPSLRSYYLAQIKKIGYAYLHSRHNSVLPRVTIENNKLDSDGMISQKLINKISKNLKQKKQAMLFLNRRGSAKAMICQTCGNISKCPNCNVSLHYHADIGNLLCHYCNFKSKPPAICEICRGSDIRLIGEGTKKLEAEIKSRWPSAKVARIDSDNSKYDYLKETFYKLQNNKIDILIGTQMISRGLDIADLSLVGIVDSDSMLAVSDFSAAERGFQLMSQVAGRAGRRDEVGNVIIQTINPENFIIKKAADHDYKSFYEYESNLRKKFIYPPFCFLLKLHCVNKNENIAFRSAVKLVDELKQQPNIAVLGPTKYFRRTLQRQTIYQVVVKTKERKLLQSIVQNLPNNWSFDIDPINIM